MKSNVIKYFMKPVNRNYYAVIDKNNLISENAIN